MSTPWCIDLFQSGGGHAVTAVEAPGKRYRLQIEREAPAPTVAGSLKLTTTGDELIEESTERRLLKTDEEIVAGGHVMAPTKPRTLSS